MQPTIDTPWGGMQAREWQAAALDAYRERTDAGDDAGIIVAIMGAGKSVLLAEIVATTPGRVIVTCPTLRLVRQLVATLRRRGCDVGAVCTGSRELDRRVTVCTYDARTLARVAGAHVEPPALWIADEAHRTNTAGIAAWRDDVAPVRSLGLTATPYLADPDQPLRLWRSVWFHYGFAEAVRDGVIMVPTFAAVDVKRTATGDVEIIGAARAWLDLAEGPGVFSAPTVAEAERLAGALDGVEPYHSRQPIAERDDRIERLRTGEIRAIVHVSCLVEGVDLPWLRWIGLTHPRGSRVAYAQEIGRVLRTHPGKDRVLVWDPYGSAEIHGLSDPAVLGEALEEWDAGDERPSLATMQIDTDAGQLVAVFRHVADVVEARLLPCPVEVVDGGATVRIDLGTGEPVTITGGRAYPRRPTDPPETLYLRHTLEASLADLDEAADVVAPVVTPAEAVARSLVMRLSLAGLCPPLVRWIRERRDQIERRAGGLTVRGHLRSSARAAQVAWIRRRLPDLTAEPALRIVHAVAYHLTPPRVVSAYVCALILHAHEADPDAVNRIASEIAE